MVALESILVANIGAALRQPLTDLYSAIKQSVKNQVEEVHIQLELGRLDVSIGELSRVRTICSPNPLLLQNFYYPSRVVTKRGASAVVNSLSDIETTYGGNCYFVTGTAGQGKSVFLRYLAVSEAERGDRIPLFVSLRHIDASKSLRRLLIDALFDLGLDLSRDDKLDLVLKNGKFSVFLDGLDEVKKEYVILLKDELRVLTKKFSNHAWIISTRPGAVYANFSEIPNVTEVKLAKLSAKDLRPFLETIGVDIEARDRLITAVELPQNKRVLAVVDTPLMATLLVRVYGNVSSIPDNLPELYDGMFSMLISTHDDTKPGYIRQTATGLSSSKIRTLFECFCFVSLDFGSASLGFDQFCDGHDKAVEITGINCGVEGWRSDVVEVLCLMVKEGGDTSFLHKTIQEYFAAYFVKRIDDETIVSRIYEEFFDHRKIIFQEQFLQFLEIVDSYNYNKFFTIPACERFLNKYDFRKGKGIAKNSFYGLLSEMKVLVAGVSRPDAILFPSEIEVFSNPCMIDIFRAVSVTPHVGRGVVPITEGALLRRVRGDAELREKVFSEVNKAFLKIDSRLDSCKKQIERRRLSWSLLCKSRGSDEPKA